MGSHFFTDLLTVGAPSLRFLTETPEVRVFCEAFRASEAHRAGDFGYLGLRLRLRLRLYFSLCLSTLLIGRFFSVFVLRFLL
jgi:hypothetical protein